MTKNYDTQSFPRSSYFEWNRYRFPSSRLERVPPIRPLLNYSNRRKYAVQFAAASPCFPLHTLHRNPCLPFPCIFHLSLSNFKLYRVVYRFFSIPNFRSYFYLLSFSLSLCDRATRYSIAIQFSIDQVQVFRARETKDSL